MFSSWKDITSLYNLYINVNKYREMKQVPNDMPHPIFAYRPKIKLHGTNAAIRIENEQIYAQSRTQDLSASNTNAGFYTYVMENQDFYQHLSRFKDTTVLVYGEWAGPGVQNGTALSQLKEKIFAIYAMVINGQWIIDPKEIALYLGFDVLPPNTYILPWAGGSIEIDYKEKNQVLIDRLNQWIHEIEKEDPWVKSVFGVSGIGEGLVFYPLVSNIVSPDNRSYQDWGNWMFKAKGEAHQVKKEKAPIVIDSEKIDSINQFIETFLTEPRLQQAVSIVNPSTRADTGKFIKWIAEDILKESKNELVESGLEWKEISGNISKRASTWLLDYLTKR